MWSEWNVSTVELVFYLSARSCAVSGNFVCTKRLIIGKQLFYEYQNEKQHN